MIDTSWDCSVLNETLENSKVRCHVYNHTHKLLHVYKRLYKLPVDIPHQYRNDITVFNYIYD
jgi:hypothetical protein